MSTKVDFTSADVLKLSFKNKNETYVLMCVYRLSKYNNSLFAEEFSNLLDNEKSKNLIIFGDFNIDILENNDISSY